MGKKIHDWEAYKSEYLESDTRDISEFLQAKCGHNAGTKLSGNTRDKTKGRKEEKKKLYQKLFNEFEPSGKALQKIKNTLEKACEFLPELLKGWMIGTSKNITQYQNYPKIKEIREFIEIIEPFSKFGFQTKNGTSDIEKLPDINEEDLTD